MPVSNGSLPRRLRAEWPNYLFVLPQVVFFVLFLAWPLISGIQISLHDWKIMAATQRFIGAENYIAMWKDATWWQALRSSFTFTAIVMSVNTALALLTAIVLRQRFAGRGFFRLVFYLPSVLSVTVLGILAIRVWDPQNGILNYVTTQLLGLAPVAWWTPRSEMLILALTTVWWTFGFPMLVFLAGLRNIPEQIYEAGRMDGAGAWQMLFRITLPLLKPSLLFVLATQFMTHMQMFGQAYALGGPETQTVFVYMFDNAWKFFRFGYASAMGVALTVIIVIAIRILFMLLGRRVEY